MGFEPTRGNPNGLAVHRLNHSATSSYNASYLLLCKQKYSLQSLLLPYYRLIDYFMFTTTCNQSYILMEMSD